jgi:hypothetical protein
MLKPLNRRVFGSKSKEFIYEKALTSKNLLAIPASLRMHWCAGRSLSIYAAVQNIKK